MRRHLILCSAVTLMGCGQSTAVDGGAPDLRAPQPPTVSAVVRANADDVVTAQVDVTTGGATGVSIEYGDSVTYGQKTPTYPVADGVRTFTIVGLTASATSHLRVTATGGGMSARTDDLTVATGALPSELPAFTVTTPSAAVSGYLMMGAVRISDFGAFGMIIDRNGRIVWYRKAKGSAKGLQFDRLPDGNFVFYRLKLPGFEEVGLDGTRVRTWYDGVAPLGADGHEFFLLPNRNAVMIGIDQHAIDTRPYFDGGVADANEVFNSLDELDPDGGAAFHWATFPDITPGDLVPDVTPPSPNQLDMAHGNAAALAPDGNYIYHSRAVSTLLKVDRQTGAILWRLGGRRSDFTFVNDPSTGPSHGHDFHYINDTDILCVDNGIEHTPKLTRAIVYRLDERARTATLVWEYRHAPDLYSPLAGSARRMANGNTLVTFAQAGWVTEVDMNKNVVWEMQQTTNYVMYRTIPLPSIY